MGFGLGWDPGELAEAVRRSSPGPVFHRQERVGRDRRPFEMLKFRSMRVDAQAESGPVWAAENDPRRTRYDLFYVENWSIWLDLRILAMTVWAVFRHRGS